MQEIQSSKFSWIDIHRPEKSDINSIQKRFNLHPILVDEFSTPTIRPKASEYDTCLYLAIHIPLFDREQKTTYPGEIDMVITENALITSHFKEISQLSEIFHSLKNDDQKREILMSESPAKLMHYIIEKLLESCFPKLDNISKKLERIEKETFKGNEKEMVLEISKVKRDILHFRRTMKPQRSIIESLVQKEYRLIGPELKPYFQDLVGTNIRIWNNLESEKETIESLEETNNSLLSTKLDVTMKVLTIFSAIMLPLTVYSNFLAMSADIPFGKYASGFWLHIGIAFIIAAITIAIFKAKKWL
ncbi:MAG: magnesium transporter CorA family protein [Candidatus Moranbacteria bacterium]|nr:magnesium transporter CorA family protein [Candidatus Moranbacteria bacterium]